MVAIFLFIKKFRNIKNSSREKAVFYCAMFCTPIIPSAPPVSFTVISIHQISWFGNPANSRLLKLLTVGRD